MALIQMALKLAARGLRAKVVQWECSTGVFGLWVGLDRFNWVLVVARH